MKITKEDIKLWIESTSGDWFELSDIRKELNIDDTQSSNLRRAMHYLCQEGVCQSLGGKTGRYRKIDQDAPAIKFWESTLSDTKLNFPRGFIDNTSFSFADKLRLEPVTILTIGGVSQGGKTALSMNILGENVDTSHIKYFSSENNSYNFWDRLQKIGWVDFFYKIPPKDLSDCKFEYIPKNTVNYADVISGADIYIIDWINLTERIWEISSIIEGIKNKLNKQVKGIAVVVLQKDDKRAIPRGDTWVKDHSDLLMTIDKMGKESRLTITKCKVCGELDNKMWGFGLEGGIQLKDIREIVHCSVCHGNGKVWDKLTHNQENCIKCEGTGYRNKDDDNHDV